MAKIRTLWVIVTTADVPDADTEDKFDLVISGFAPNPQSVKRFPFPNLPNPDERERARTDEYRFDVRSLDSEIDLLDGGNIAIEILGNDAWLPSTIWVIGEDASANRRLLAGIPRWPNNQWWSKDLSEGKPSRPLLLQP